MLEDRWRLLFEIDAIARDFDAVIQSYAPPADCDEIWRRIEAVRATVLRQLSAVVNAAMH
jgi:hypothetical protein